MSIIGLDGLEKVKRRNKIIFLVSFPLFLILLTNQSFVEVKAFTVSGRLVVLPTYDIGLRIYVDDQLCPSQPRGYCLGYEMNISNELENVVDYDISGDLVTKILNQTDDVIDQTDWTSVDVQIGETIYENTTYTIREEDEPGIYNITSNYSYNDEYSFAYCEFWVYKGIGNLLVSENEFLFFIPPGKSDFTEPPLGLRLFQACDNTTIKMNKTSDPPGDWVSFDLEDVFLFSDGTANSTNITIDVPMDTDLGNYYGWINVTADDQQEAINLTVVVSILDFYVKTRIPEDKEEVCLGSDVYAQVNVTKVSPPGEAEVNMTYQLLREGNVVVETKENFTLNDTFNSTIKVPIIRVPSNAITGNYTFLSHLEHEELFYESADNFTVKDCGKPKPPEEGGGGGGGGGGPIKPPVETQLLLNLSTNLISVITDSKTSFVATVENTGDTAIDGVKISIEGIPSDWIETVPPIIIIPERGIQGYLVMITVPIDAETGVYQLEVKATNDVESNTEILTLIIGESLREVADLMLIEYQRLLGNVTKSLLVDDCLDITFIKILYEDAQLAFDKGLNEYENKNYAQAINWFEYAMPLEKKVISRVDINIEMELLASNSSKVLIPPFYESEEQFIQAQAYLEEKNYEEICDPIEEIRKQILIGLIFWPAIIILIMFVIIILIFFYRYKRKRERSRILERVKQRLIPES